MQYLVQLRLNSSASPASTKDGIDFIVTAIVPPPLVSHALFFGLLMRTGV